MPDTQAVAVPQEAAYGSLAPTGPDSTPTGLANTPAGPDSTFTGPDRTPAGPGSTPAEPDRTPAGPDSTPAGPDSTPAGPDSTPTAPDSTPTGLDSTPARPSGANDDLVLGTPACSQSDASLSLLLDGPAASVGPSTTATALGVGSEQDGDGAKSSSPTVEPESSDAAGGPSSVGATVGMTAEVDGGDGVGPSGLGAAADCEVHDLTGPSEDFAQVRLHTLACVASSRLL